MPDSTHEMWERVSALEARVNHELASRVWVTEALAPVKESSLRTEHAIQMLTNTVRELTDDTRSLYASHDQLLKERAERELLEHKVRLKAAEENTWMNFLKDKWMPLATFILTSASVLTLAGEALRIWLQHSGLGK